jgi:glutathione S-transferase
VPVLEHDGFALYETQAILRYLDRVLPTPSLTPADPRCAARMDQAMNVNDWYLFQGVANVIVFHRVVGPRVMGLEPDEAAIEAAMPKARQVFAELARLLGEQPWFGGETLSLADLHSRRPVPSSPRRRNGPNSARPHQNLVAWLARMEARPSTAS